MPNPYVLISDQSVRGFYTCHVLILHQACGLLNKLYIEEVHYVKPPAKMCYVLSLGKALSMAYKRRLSKVLILSYKPSHVIL